jgi:hypothetical protein
MGPADLVDMAGLVDLVGPADEVGPADPAGVTAELINPGSA